MKIINQTIEILTESGIGIYNIISNPVASELILPTAFEAARTPCPYRD
ncbi:MULTISPECIES: hypothetical protein [unclassified Microcoleus]